MERSLKLTIISEMKYRVCSSVVHSGANMNRLHKAHWQNKNKSVLDYVEQGKVHVHYRPLEGCSN
jgi:hypothetical protein